MSTPHYVLVGLARARSAWFRDLGRWSTSAAIPCDFVKCVSVHELRARLEAGRPFSALLVDGSLPSLDRDLVDLCRSAGCAVIAVDDGRANKRDWATLGVSAVLTEPIARGPLMSVLQESARPLERAEVESVREGRTHSTGGWRGRLIAVTGAGGTGTSTVCMALAQGLGDDARRAGRVLLADLALDADQAMLHDTGDVVPGLQELVEAFRAGEPSLDEVRSLTHTIDGRGYRLLSGLRRHRDWTAVRPRAFGAALDALRCAFTTVVADIDADLEGADDSGSVEVEDRNLLARGVTSAADVVVVTGTATVGGLHRLVRVADALLRHNVDAARILPVLIRAPRPGRARAELTRALGELTSALANGPVTTSPVFVPERRHMDRDIRDAARIAKPVVHAVVPAVEAMLDRIGPAPGQVANDPVPVRVTPGSLGSWSDDELAG